jgi:hypothetical protein
MQPAGKPAAATLATKPPDAAEAAAKNPTVKKDKNKKRAQINVIHCPSYAATASEYVHLSLSYAVTA